MAYDVVTAGNFTRDTVVSAAGARQVDGGGFAYAAHAARVAGLRVAAVTRLAHADFPVLEPLREAGVTVFAYQSAHSTLLRLEYPTTDPDQRTVTVTDTADPIEPRHLEGIESAAVVVNASLRGEVPLATLEVLRARARVLALDVQGFLRVADDRGRLAHAPWPDAERVLRLVDVLKADAVEAEFLTAANDHVQAARALAALGPREVVLTHASGVLVLAEGDVHQAPFRPRELRGRSGRGDTCIGAYVSKRLTSSPAEATRWAAAVTSLKLEAEGPIRRPPADVLALLDEG
ncbi:MAG TPA: PfkB family carbohydrate kinase [Vicinamibacteria bacterium]|nr:PfkB family carbohydrate kinase [Vicinamibacteria bacterium]